MSKYKIGDVVSLDLPDNTFMPIMRAHSGIASGMAISMNKTVYKVSNKDKFTIVEPFFGFILAKLNDTENMVRLPEDKIMSNAKKIRERLGVK